MFNVTDTQVIAVKIDSVDSTNRVVNVIDKFGKKFKVRYNFTGTVYSIPNPGETWLMYQSQSQWYLERKYEDDGTNIEQADLSPGDTKISAQGAIELDSSSLNFNGMPFGVTTWERFELQGASSFINLANSPLDIRTVQVYNNQMLVDPIGITIPSGSRASYPSPNLFPSSTLYPGGAGFNVLAFDPPLAAGVVIVYYQYTPTYLKYADLVKGLV